MPFTPVQTFLGGYLLHLSTSSLLDDTGRVLGISGIVNGALFDDKAGWRWTIIGGLLGGPLVLRLVGLDGLILGDGVGSWEMLGQTVVRTGIAGVLIGFGSKLGSGCTSGHFLCGVSRLSPRSIIATATFFTTAMITANTLPLTSSSPTSSYKSRITPLNTSAWSITLPTTLDTGLLVGTIGLTILLRNFWTMYPKRTHTPPHSLISLVPYLSSGLIFSLGLLLSGMSDPAKVLNFLNLSNFDPSLAFIVLGGVIPNYLHYRSYASSTEPRSKTLLPWEQWRVPTSRTIDWRLVLGSAVFGIGWGLGGICPGPALVGLGRVLSEIVGGGVRLEAMKGLGVCLGGMVGGMSLAGLV